VYHCSTAPPEGTDVQHATRRLRRSTALLGLTALLPAVTACSSNFDSPVLQPYNPSVGVYDRSGTVEAFNVLAVTDDQGSGTLVASLINQGDEPDRLTAVDVQAEGDRQVTAQLRGPVDLEPKELVLLHEGPSVTLAGDGLEAGYFMTLTMEFERAETVTLRIPTETNGGPYADVPIG
jgi:hypothetical protein